MVGNQRLIVQGSPMPLPGARKQIFIRVLHQTCPNGIEVNVIYLLHESVFAGYAKRVGVVFVNRMLWRFSRS